MPVSSQRPNEWGFAWNEAPWFMVVWLAALSKRPYALVFDDAAARALGVLHFAHRFVLPALHTALIGRLTIPIAAFIEVFRRVAHNVPPLGRPPEL